MEVLAAGHYCCLLAINIFAGSPVKNFETQKRISQLGFSAQNSPNRYENRNSMKLCETASQFSIKHCGCFTKKTKRSKTPRGLRGLRGLRSCARVPAGPPGIGAGFGRFEALAVAFAPVRPLCSAASFRRHVQRRRHWRCSFH